MLFALNRDAVSTTGTNGVAATGLRAGISEAPVAGVSAKRVAAVLACTLFLAGCCLPAQADGPPPSPEDLAGDLAAEVLRRAGGGGDGLGDWTRDVIGRALERAGRSATESAAGESVAAAPLPAERHAAAFADARPHTAEIVLFTSLSVPEASWRQMARDAARIGAPLVLRGVGPDGFRATVKAIGTRLGGHDVGVAIDPRLFRLFRIARVPAVAVVPGGVPPCRSRGCSDDAPPPFDLVTGNIGLAAALEAVAAEGGSGRAAARRVLAALEGGVR